MIPIVNNMSCFVLNQLVYGHKVSKTRIFSKMMDIFILLLNYTFHILSKSNISLLFVFYFIQDLFHVSIFPAMTTIKIETAISINAQ